MKIFASLLFLIGFSTFALADNTTTEILRCTRPLPGAPVYTLQQVDPDEGVVFYRLVKQPNNPFYGPYTEDLTYEQVIVYGETTILTENQGRSGYAMIYDQGDVTLIDINLFQNPDMNTDGPVTGYQCERPEPGDGA